jgi:hypothetical protein
VASLMLALTLLLSFAAVSSAQSPSPSPSPSPTTPTTPTTRATTTTVAGGLSKTGAELLLPLAAGGGIVSLVVGMRRLAGANKR